MLAALSLTKAAGDPEIEGGIETSLMMGFRDQHRPEEAIFFGMEAVSSYQQIRKNISGLDKDLQAGFAQSKSMTYRILAELLVQAGRLGEAEADSRSAQRAGVERHCARRRTRCRGQNRAAEADRCATEGAGTIWRLLEKMAVALTELCMEYVGLQAKATRTSDGRRSD